MGYFGNVAVETVKLIHSSSFTKPLVAWKNASATKGLGLSSSMQKKGCPKGAFLGLCSAGLVKGVPSGNYTRSVKNAMYAVTAVSLLKVMPTLANSNSLWNFVLLHTGQWSGKKHNGQMDVVIALWDNGLIL